MLIPFFDNTKRLDEDVDALLQSFLPVRLMLGVPTPGPAVEFTVAIEADDAAAFTAEPASEVPPAGIRFPASIRAAATALRNHGCFGVFRISHEAEMLTIQRLAA